MLGGDVVVGTVADVTYRFDGATGALLQTFTPPPGLPQGFGTQVGTMGSNVLVGTFAGTVYLFDGTTGALLRTIVNPRAGGIVRGVAAVGNAIFVGYSEDDTQGPVAGAVYRLCGGAAGCAPCETCGAGGSCVLAPHPGCRPPGGPGKSALRIADVARPQGDRVAWKWRGPGPTVAEFALPLEATDYSLCLYDEAGPASLVFRATAPASGTCGTRPCWRLSFGVQTYTYKDPDKTPDGVKFTRLQGSDAGDALLLVRAAGEHLSGRPQGLPTLPLGTPLRAQLQARDAGCWEAVYSAPSVNTTQHFVGTSD